MTDSIPKIMDALVKALRGASLESTVSWNESQFLFVGYNSIQLVVVDGEKLERVKAVVRVVHAELAASGVEFDYEVRAKWVLEHIANVQPLFSGDGGLRAASVIAVSLKSGRATLAANVIITWAADKAIREIVPKVDLKDVATALIQAKLAQGGSTAWDPTREPTLEVNAAAAPYVSHLLQRAA